MRRTINSITKLILVALIAAAMARESFALTGSDFLKIANGTAEIALGQTGVTHARGGSAVWWNPALMADGQPGISLQSFKGLGDGKGIYGAGAFKTSFGGFGVSLFDLGTPGFEVRNRPGPAVGSFTIHHSILSLATAFRLPYGFGAGFAIKGTMEEIFDDLATDYPLLDVGLIWRREWLTAGLAASNFQLSERNNQDTPVTFRPGISARKSFGDYGLMAALEASIVQDSQSGVHFGLEGDWRDRYFLRGGAVMIDSEVRPSFGLGLTFDTYTIDAATTLFDKSLGSTWRLGLGMKL